MIYEDRIDTKCEDQVYNLTTFFASLKMLTKIDDLIFITKKTFYLLQNLFIHATIFYFFDPKYHINIKCKISYYAIDKILRKLTFNNSGL